MTTVPERPGTWHVLSNNIVLLETWDQESSSVEFSQIQTARPVEREDLRRFDEEGMPRLARFASRWSLLITIGTALLRLAVVAIPIGFVLGQLDATETLGSWVFWVSIPVAAVLYAALRLLAWRLDRMLKTIQKDAGFVPGMIDDVEQQRARDLIETHGTTFTMQQATA